MRTEYIDTQGGFVKVDILMFLSHNLSKLSVKASQAQMHIADLSRAMRYIYED